MWSVRAEKQEVGRKGVGKKGEGDAAGSISLSEVRRLMLSGGGPWAYLIWRVQFGISFSVILCVLLDEPFLPGLWQKIRCFETDQQQ